jgi:hypothetical protein
MCRSVSGYVVYRHVLKRDSLEPQKNPNETLQRYIFNKRLRFVIHVFQFSLVFLVHISFS